MELTTSGMIFLVLAWIIILGISGYSFYKVFTLPKKK